MRYFLRVLCCFLLVSQANLSAVPELPQGVVSTPGQPILEDGTPVKLRMAQTVSSADAHVDDKVEFEVFEEVRVADVLVITKGRNCLGEQSQKHSPKDVWLAEAN